MAEDNRLDYQKQIEMAEEAMGKALLEEDTVDRYTLFRYAELRIRIAEVYVLKSKRYSMYDDIERS